MGTSYVALSIAAYIAVCACFGMVGYFLGVMVASQQAEIKAATMRKDYMDAVNAIYQKYSMQMTQPMPPRPAAKPRPQFHIFRNDINKDDKPST